MPEATHRLDRDPGPREYHIDGASQTLNRALMDAVSQAAAVELTAQGNLWLSIGALLPVHASESILGRCPWRIAPRCRLHAVTIMQHSVADTPHPVGPCRDRCQGLDSRRAKVPTGEDRMMLPQTFSATYRYTAPNPGNDAEWRIHVPARSTPRFSARVTDPLLQSIRQLRSAQWICSQAAED